MDNEKALHWLREAAFAGFPSAAFQLYGACVEGQLGVDVDLKEALKWYSLAASNGAEYCQYILAKLYSGQCGPTISSKFCGVEINQEKALRWLKKAARNGQKDALYQIGRCYHYALHIGAENTVHLSSAFAEDRGLYGENDEYKRVEKGEVSILIPHEKQLVLENSDMALRCYRKAARAGSIEAMEELAFIYTDSDGIISIKDEAAALMWKEKAETLRCYIKAARAGSIEAMDKLAFICGRTDKDEAAALMWKEKAKIAMEMCAGGVAQNDDPIDKSPPASESDLESESDSDSESELSFLGVSESDSDGAGSEEDETEEELDSGS